MQSVWKKSGVGVAASVVALAACGIGSSARGDVRVGVATMEAADWRYTAIVDTSIGEHPAIGFLGLLNPAIKVGNNITAIWYARDGAGGWTTSAWAGEDQWKVIEAVKSKVGMSGSSDSDWFAWSPKDDPATPPSEAEALYDKGFLVGDPIGDMARESGMHDEIVEFLKETGYQVANVKFEKTSAEGCGSGPVLNWMSGVVSAAEVSGTSEAVESAIAMFSCGINDIDWWPYWTTTPVGEPPWGPLGPPSTTPGDWPWHDVGTPPGSTLVLCGYQYTVTQTRTRVRKRYYIGIGWTTPCTETQTYTCVYSCQCINDQPDATGACHPTPTCPIVPSAPTCTESDWTHCW